MVFDVSVVFVLEPLLVLFPVVELSPVDVVVAGGAEVLELLEAVSFSALLDVAVDGDEVDVSGVEVAAGAWNGDETTFTVRVTLLERPF